MFSQTLEHNQSYQDASPSISFLLISNVLQLLRRTCCVWGCTRLRLVSHVSRLKIFVLTRSPLQAFGLNHLHMSATVVINGVSGSTTLNVDLRPHCSE